MRRLVNGCSAVSARHIGLMPRPRLLVILGAGSTLHARAPSTEAITDFVCQIKEEPIRSVVDRLREQRTEGNFNFETVIAALGDLDEFSVRKRCPTTWPRIGGHLSAFAEFLSAFVRVADKSFMAARLQLIGRIKDFVIQRTAEASPMLKAFFDQLRAEFDLTVVTLNYDDLMDRTGEWYDGFNQPVAPDRFGTFDFSGFPRQSIEHPAVLLHLHGSVRFNLPPWRLRNGDIVRHLEPVRGLGSTLNPPGGIVQPIPIVAGDGKDQWMTRACVPFGYYYNAFVNAAHACPRLLVAGYGAGDLHVTSWLDEEYPRVHGTERRIVHINPALPKGLRTLECLTLGGDDGYFPPQDRDRIQEVVDFLKSV
jgi:hypothetical protein